MNDTQWTTLDQEIVTALTCRVHVLSEDQLQRGWGLEFAEDQIAESFKRLADSQLIQMSLWHVVAPPVNGRPLCVWKPGDDRPDGWLLSRAARNRWHAETTEHVVVQATPLAAALFGSRAGRESRNFERQHDLLLAEVYVQYRVKLPELARCWVGEDALPIAEHGVKNPDAFLFDDDFTPRRVIESAGAYSQSQVESFHRYCQHARLPYELW